MVHTPIVGQVAVALTVPVVSDVRSTRAGFLAQAAQEAFAALTGADPDPTAEAERAAFLAGAEPPPDGSALSQPMYCFPCGALVPDGRRRWLDACGLCCVACAERHGATQ